MRTLIILAAALALAGCSGETAPSVITPSTETVTAPPAEEVTEPEISLSDEEMTALAEWAIEAAWEDMTLADRRTLCEGWNTLPDHIIEGFMEGSGEWGDVLTQEALSDFLDQACEGY